MVPDDVHRSLFPWELHTNFAAIELGVNAVAAVLATHLADDRAKLIELLAADLAAAAASPGDMPPDVAVAYRVLALNSELGLDAIPGAGALLADAEARYRGQLDVAATAGADQVTAEAEAQGVQLVKARLDRTGEYRLDLAARRLAEQPMSDVLKAAADFAYRMPDATTGALAGRVVDQLRQLSADRLTGYARPPVQQADGLGRQAAVTGGGGTGHGLVLPERIYASELLDRNTCGPCSMIDGTEYQTLDEARSDYPNGQYRNCEGGDLCRGTLVFVWGSEVQ